MSIPVLALQHKWIKMKKNSVCTKNINNNNNNNNKSIKNPVPSSVPSNINFESDSNFDDQTQY
jgi:hypothetical protein